MKYLFILLVFISCTCSAQKYKGELLPVIKPSFKIDSILMDYSKKCFPATKDSCFVISLGKIDGYLSLNITMDYKAHIEERLAKAHIRKEFLGYFIFNGNKFFLQSSENTGKLFSKTGNLERIDFIDFSHTPTDGKIPSNIINYVCLMGSYKYQNGHFITDDSNYDEQY
jgi:hypothetical protein